MIVSAIMNVTGAVTHGGGGGRGKETAEVLC